MTTVTDTPGAPDASNTPGVRGAHADRPGRARARFEVAAGKRTHTERGTQPQ